MRQRAIAAVAVAILAIAVSACGSSKKSTSTSSASGGAASSGATTPPSSSGAAAKPTGVKVALSKVSFGQVLVGPNAHTVYLFMKDKGTTSECNGKCATVWSPLMTSGQPQAGSGLKASLLGTSKRKDGNTQVTYGGHPLYYYDDDKRPGMTKGEGSKEFGAEWYAVGANGKKVEKKGS
jgi:predicted lipoprotein with Yx(FWY)xxD motif